jgi:hypothetical protein
MHLNSNGLPNLIWRLKLAINPATRFLLVGLFFSGLTSSYFDDLRTKTHPQDAANPDVENHPPKPAIVFVRAGWDSLKLHFRSGDQATRVSRDKR